MPLRSLLHRLQRILKAAGTDEIRLQTRSLGSDKSVLSLEMEGGQKKRKNKTDDKEN